MLRKKEKKGKELPNQRKSNENSPLNTPSYYTVFNIYKFSFILEQVVATQSVHARVGKSQENKKLESMN